MSTNMSTDARPICRSTSVGSRSTRISADTRSISTDTRPILYRRHLADTLPSLGRLLFILRCIFSTQIFYLFKLPSFALPATLSPRTFKETFSGFHSLPTMPAPFIYARDFFFRLLLISLRASSPAMFDIIACSKIMTVEVTTTKRLLLYLYLYLRPLRLSNKNDDDVACEQALVLEGGAWGSLLPPSVFPSILYI